jgi:putative heme transporter
LRSGGKRRDEPDDVLEEPRRAVEASDTDPRGADTNGDEAPRVLFTRARVVGTLLFVASALAFLYFVLPKLLGLHETWDRIQHGNAWWFGLAAVLEVCSFLGYVVLFRGVFVQGESRIDWRESYQITLAGLAATRLFAAAGAGGIALTAWALRRSGMGRGTVARRLIAFTVILYAVYMITLVVDGVGLYLGVIPGGGSFAITMAPAIFGAVVIIVFLGISMLPREMPQMVGRLTAGRNRLERLGIRLAQASATAASGIRTAIDLVRQRNPSLLGAIAWWGFDIAVLWACFHAFGASPPKGVIVMSYFVGMLANTLPLPGGIGGVDGGMIGAFVAFGVDAELSVVAVLAYRAFAFWLPTLPGAVAYFQLRRTVNRWSAEPPAVLRSASDAVS